MESGRMPFSAARHPLQDVDPAGGCGPGPMACADAQVGGLLRRGQPAQWPIRVYLRAEVQRDHFRAVPQAAASPPPAAKETGGGAGQRALSSRQSAQAVAATAPNSVGAVVPAAVQPAAGSDRAGLEVGPAAGDAQSVLCGSGERSYGGRILFRVVEETQRGPEKIMRYYLRRCV